MAYRKEKRASNWRQLTIFTTGGGARISSLSAPLKKKPWGHLEGVQLKSLRIEGVLIPDGVSPTCTSSDFSDLVPIAYGLSFHRAEYGKLHLPGAVGPYQPRLPERMIPDFDPDRD